MPPFKIQLTVVHTLFSFFYISICTLRIYDAYNVRYLYFRRAQNTALNVLQCLQSNYSQNPLFFWKEHGYMVAIILFSINSLHSLSGCLRVLIPLESMFSVTGLICNSRRSRLSPDKLHKICFLHDNIDFIVGTDNE